MVVRFTLERAQLGEDTSLTSAQHAKMIVSTRRTFCAHPRGPPPTCSDHRRIPKFNILRLQPYKEFVWAWGAPWNAPSSA